MPTDAGTVTQARTPVLVGALPGDGAGAARAPWTLVLVLGAALALVGLLGLNVMVNVVAVGLQALFIAYFLRHLSFGISAARSAPTDLDATVVDTGYRPTVSVLVACRNEQTVVDSLVASLLALDYPRRRLELVVVDDASTDATGPTLDRLAAASRGRVQVLHRPAGATGGKSGALNDGLALATGEVVVVFDADHRPRPDTVVRLVRHFEDPAVGAVQGRCVISNPDDSLISRLVAIDYLAGYLVNEYGRQSLFRLPAYGGANCAVRASSLRAMGGWNPASVTEDTDLTLRLVLKGETVRYDVEAVDEEEGVVTLERYWRQRYRWARGHQQVWRDYRRAVLAAGRLTFGQKLETVMFLLAFHVPVAAAAGFVVLGLWLFGAATPIDPIGTYVLWTLLFLGPMLELGAGLLVAQADRRLARSMIFFVPLYVVSVALCTKAWVDGLLGRPYRWVKTARAGDPAEAGAS